MREYEESNFDKAIAEAQKHKDPKAKSLMDLSQGELTYFRYLYEIFWGGYKRAKILTPDPKLVRRIVDGMAYEPFGEPGKTTTVDELTKKQSPEQDLMDVEAEREQLRRKNIKDLSSRVDELVKEKKTRRRML